MTGQPTRAGPGRRSGLFLRIYLTFVITVIAFAIAAGLAMYSLAKSYDADWVAHTVDTVTEHNDEIWNAREDTERLQQSILALELALDARVHLLPRGGDHEDHEPTFATRVDGAPAHHRLDRRERRMLKHGRPVVHPRGPLRPPLVVWRIVDPQSERLAAVVVVDTPPGSKRGMMLLGLGVGMLVLGGGAFVLARPLIRRLAALERDTLRFAAGDWTHRARVEIGASTDEIDQLAVAFNDMADRIGALVTGQQTLLANVSHELRTPVARMRVLIEILHERLAGATATPPDAATVARIEKGLREMNDDLAEVGALIDDLLTSGRLELGRDGVLQLDSVEVRPLLDKLALRFDAEVVCEPAEIAIDADALLLERLLSNLLANGRRAGAEGRLLLSGRLEEDALLLEVEDQGPGIPADEREHVFEPFARLDDARDRDRGGVGLGLHLCRQIAQAHGGTIHAEGRRDGGRGARLVVRLPRR